MANTILNRLGLDPKEHPISAAFRKGGTTENSGLPRPVIIKFENKRVRDAVLKKSRKVDLYTSIFNSRGKDREGCSTEQRNKRQSKIYIQEHITVGTKYLHKLARDLKKSKLIEYVWVWNGKLFIKVKDGEPPICINNKNQLNESNFK